MGAWFVGGLVVQPVLLLLHAVPWVILVRPLPLLALAAHVARLVRLRRSWPVVLGLVLGGFGDAAMTLRHGPVSSAPLLAGIVLFFLGHASYSVAFFRERGARREGVLGAAFFVVVAHGAAALLLPRLGALALPVAAYAAALTAMTALASLRRSPRRTVLAGAALFFVSDVLIAARLATPAVPFALLVLVLPTYYFGQYLIAAGWTRDALAEPDGDPRAAPASEAAG